MLIVEGIDGTGKTSLVNSMLSNGFSKYHFEYDIKNMDLVSKYLKIIEQDPSKFILDRSFISEIVYGPVMRGFSKLTEEEYIFLLKAYSKVGTNIIYLTAPKDILLKRRIDDIEDFKMLNDNYERLNNQYEYAMDIANNFVDVITIDTCDNSEIKVYQKVRKIINNE